MTKRLGFVFLLLSSPAWGQLFSAGVKAGVPLTDFFTTEVAGVHTNTNRYIIGPTAELHLPRGFGIEVDALYRHMGYVGGSPHPSGIPGVETFHSGRWEFPVLVKYRFKAPVARPFVNAGIAWDTLSGVSQSFAGGFFNNETMNVVEKNSTAGFVIGGGIDVHVIRMHIMPEIRYTRWGSTQLNDQIALLQSNLNQAEFLVGVTF